MGRNLPLQPYTGRALYVRPVGGWSEITEYHPLHRMEVETRSDRAVSSQAGGLIPELWVGVARARMRLGGYPPDIGRSERATDACIPSHRRMHLERKPVLGIWGLGCGAWYPQGCAAL